MVLNKINLSAVRSEMIQINYLHINSSLKKTTTSKKSGLLGFKLLSLPLCVLICLSESPLSGMMVAEMVTYL